MDDVLKLVSKTYTKDKYGVDKATETKREVFCECLDVTQREFFEAGRNGLNPEYEFKIARVEYQGESVIEYRGQRYVIYRTYKPKDDPDIIELYAERKGGDNG